MDQEKIYRRIEDAVRDGVIRLPLAEYVRLVELEPSVECVTVRRLDDEGLVWIHLRFAGRPSDVVERDLVRLGFATMTWYDGFTGTSGVDFYRFVPSPRATNPSPRHFHHENLDDALRAGVVAMPLADAMTVKSLEHHAGVSIFPLADAETLVLLYYPEGAPPAARRDLEAVGFRGRPVAPSLGGGERFSKIYPTTRARNPRYPAAMARAKRPLSEDPIGDKFDRLVEHLTPKHGVVTARRIAAVSLNKAYPGALAAARRKADAERRAGLRPPRKARGTARTPPTHAGDLRRGDLFTVGRGTTVYLAMAHAEPRRVKGKYVTAVWAAVGRAAPVRSRGPRPRTLLLGPTTRVLVVKPVGRTRNPAGRIDDGLVGRIIERNPSRPGLGLWDDGLDAVRSFGA